MSTIKSNAGNKPVPGNGVSVQGVQQAIDWISGIVGGLTGAPTGGAGAAARGAMQGAAGAASGTGMSGMLGGISSQVNKAIAGMHSGGGGGHGHGYLSLGSSGPAVVLLQHTLNHKGATPRLAEDGKFGRLTDAAVRRFQSSKGLVADGIVGPKTWHALNADGSVHKTLHKAKTGGIPTLHHAASGDHFFPLAQRPSPDWQGGARYFGAPRSGRLHAGCDLLAAPGTPIYAIADGVLIRGPYEFTGPPKLPVTHAVEIRHGELLVRYGEIAPGSYVGGKHVHAGQQIAKVGNCQMLHFELYSNGNSAASLSGGGPYLRRNDLTNPSPYLQRWVKNLPQP